MPESLSFRGLNRLVFITTTRCTALCRDCPIASDASPTLSLSADQMIELVDEVYSWGKLELVVFTGGESLLLGKELYRTIAHVGELGLHSRVVSNAYWARSARGALTHLKRLKNSGLSELDVSCDDYHQEFIPIENVKNAFRAANDVGIQFVLSHRRAPGNAITVERLSKYLGAELRPPPWDSSDVSLNNRIISGRNVPLGTNGGNSDPDCWDIPEDDRYWMGPCDAVLSNVVIGPTYSVQMCCGMVRNTIPELHLGSLRDENLATILERGNRDLIANWLALEGPSAILDFVLERDPALDLPAHYVSRCHLCDTLFTHSKVREILQESASERVANVLLRRAALDWASEDRRVPCA